MRALITDCAICQSLVLPDGSPNRNFVTFKGIWDTGATSSVITQRVVDGCGLKPTGITTVHNAHSTELVETFVVNLALPNKVAVPDITVAKGNLPGGGADVLIGMDIITLGDLTITNRDGITVFTFRVPSIDRVDYVKDHSAEQQKQHLKSLIKNPRSHGHGKKKGRR